MKTEQQQPTPDELLKAGAKAQPPKDTEPMPELALPPAIAKALQERLAKKAPPPKAL